MTMVHVPMRSRSVEMYMAIVMASCGVIFVSPGDTLSYPIYATLRLWIVEFPGNESNLGLLLMTIGLWRIVALVINGHWRRTPLLRLAGCILGSLYWAALSLAFIDATLQGLPVGLAWTVPALAFETFSAMKSAEDAFEQDSLGLRERHRERIRIRDV